jgi:hypothetical protein
MELIILIIFGIILFNGQDKNRYVKVGKGWNAKVKDTKTGKYIVT